MGMEWRGPFTSGEDAAVGRRPWDKFTVAAGTSSPRLAPRLRSLDLLVVCPRSACTMTMAALPPGSARRLLLPQHVRFLGVGAPVTVAMLAGAVYVCPTVTVLSLGDASCEDDEAGRRWWCASSPPAPSGAVVPQRGRGGVGDLFWPASSDARPSTRSSLTQCVATAQLVV